MGRGFSHGWGHTCRFSRWCFCLLARCIRVLLLVLVLLGLPSQDVAADASTLGDGVARAGEYCCLFIVTDARVPGVHVKMCLPKCPGFCSAASSGDFFSISWMYDPCALPMRVAAAELRSCAFNTVLSKSGWGTQAKMGRCVQTVAASLSSQHLPRS